MVFEEYLTDEMEVDRLQGADQDDDSQVDDQLEANRELLQEFLDWCNGQYDHFSFLAVVRNGEMYAELPEGGTITVNSDGELGTHGTALYPWKALWAVWQRELA